MTEHHDARLTQDTTDRAAHTATSVQGRTHAFLGLSLAVVGLMGGGIVANALFYVLVDSAPYGSGMGSIVLQGLPTLVLGLVGAALGWSGSTSTDDLAVPVGRAAMVVGVLAAIGAVALMAATQV